MTKRGEFMAKAKKLPSGKWRVQVFLGKDAEGKQIRRSITAPTKKEAEQQAALLAAQRNITTSRMTVAQAIDRYIELNRLALSPATIVGYEQAKSKLGDFGGLPISKVTDDITQKFINRLLESGLKTSAVKTHLARIITAAKSADENFKIKVKFPREEKEEVQIPTKAEVLELIEKAKGTDLYYPIQIAAFCGLRSGEIAALTQEDIKDGYISVNKSKSRVKGQDFIKSTKTGNKRRVPCPPELFKNLKASGWSGEDIRSAKISSTFRDKFSKKIFPYKFHSLRHFYASSLHSLGVPDKYIIEWGGWTDTKMLMRIYAHTQAEASEEYAKRAAKFFECTQN